MAADRYIKSQHLKQLNIGELMQKLDELYDKEEEVKRAYIQVREDIEMMQTVIMHQSNKNARSIIKP